MKKKIIISVIGLLLVGTIGYSIYSAKQASKYVSVKTAVAEKGDLKSYLSTTGTIKSKDIKEYYGSQGKVVKVYVKAGDKVTKGQPLVDFDVQDLSASVKQAQIQYDNAILSKKTLSNSDSQMSNALSSVNKQIKDLDNKINEIKNSTDTTDTTNPANTQSLAELAVYMTQKQQLSQTKSSLKPVSTEQLQQANNVISLAKVALDTAKTNANKIKKTIYANKDGVVTNVNVSVDAAYTGVQPSIVTQDLNSLKLVLSVGKYDANKIKIGETAVINDGSKDLKGKVTYVSPIAQKTVGASGSETTLSADVDISDKSSLLKVEFDNDIDILTGEKKDIIKVPVESIKANKSGKDIVYTIKDGKAVEKEVELGLQSDSDAEITSGLSEGDKVILNPTEKISNGQLILESTGVSK